MYTLEKNSTSPLCILCTLMSQIIPLLALMLGHTWYEESTPQGEMPPLSMQNVDYELNKSLLYIIYIFLSITLLNLAMAHKTPWLS